MTEEIDDEPIQDPPFGEGTKPEQEWERKVMRIVRRIDNELDEIDKASARPARAIYHAERNDEEPDSADVDRLEELDSAAEKLREQRREILEKAKDEGDESMAHYDVDWPDWRM